MARGRKSKPNEIATRTTPLETLEKLYRLGYDVSNEKEIMKLQMSAFRGMQDKTMDDYDNLDELQQAIKERTLLSFFTKEMTEKVEQELGYRPVKREKIANKTFSNTNDVEIEEEKGGADEIDD